MTNSTLRSTRLRVHPQTPNLGAVVEGVDAKHLLAQDQVDELKEALSRYKVLFFRGLNLSGEEHLAFATQFGEQFINPNKVAINRSEIDDMGIARVDGNFHWHADNMFMSQAPSFSMLRMVEMPEVGGDTMWADLVSSYSDLSESFRSFLETLTVTQAISTYYMTDEEIATRYRNDTGKDLSKEAIDETRRLYAPWESPLVRRIPETGAKNYWIAPHVTRAIKGMTSEESQAILGLLYRHQLEPKYVYRWRWAAGDLAFWDHRTTLHCGIPDYGTQGRLGYRVSVAMNTPIPV